ncbi:NAD-dependent epimerase [Desulfatiferula olefinivorans]
MSHVLVTGAAGFIGYFLSKRLLDEGHAVTGIDNLNDYYDVGLKNDRLKQLEPYEKFTFIRMDLADRTAMERLFETRFDRVVHLAAQAGVRYSLENPHAYGESNLTGFLHILEGCRAIQVPHLVYASSSSVYGWNAKIPFSTRDTVDYPVSLYAATKKANELMAHSYAHLFGIPVTGLRFFTVIGPWGRPDMAYYKFTKAILEGRPIDVYNHGKMKRDFTYIDDIVEGVVRVMDHIPEGKPAPYAVFNIGNHAPVELGLFIEAIEEALGIPAKKNMLPMQPGDVPATYADIDDLTRAVGFRPTVDIREGVRRFTDWYKAYTGITRAVS